MNVTHIKKRVEEIRECQHDDEKAHVLEDKLHQDVLTAIADGSCVVPRRAATEAIKTMDIEYSRWCA